MMPMNPVRHILNKILEDIIPTKQELLKIENIVKQLKDLLNSRAKVLNIEYTNIEAQGSTGIKNTQLKGDFDIDLFIGLDYELYKHNYKGLSKNKKKKQLKSLFLKLCNSWLIKSLQNEHFSEPRLLYAEHPYVTTYYLMDNDKIKVDIVLYFDLSIEYIDKNGPITAVDRSPWHGRFIRDNLSFSQKNDVRLLKQFFKAAHCYGDKSAVGRVGFIGYSAELLIYYFGDIITVFEHFHELEKTFLDYYHRSNKELNDIKHFQNDYLIIIDPIDKNRNVASAISKSAYKYCKYLILKFLKAPETNYFELSPIPEANLNEFDEDKIKHFYILELLNKNPDKHYTVNRDKLYSLADSIKATGEKEYNHTERFGNIEFELYFNETTNEYDLSFFVEHPNISQIYLRQGPPFNEKYHMKKFKEKNPNFIARNDYLWVETKRDYIDFLKFLSEYVNENLPENFQIINISTVKGIKTSLAKKTLHILNKMVLPFI
jgi:tRNA nucleotidyltransferase (CCA-adding enzyme)